MMEGRGLPFIPRGASGYAELEGGSKELRPTAPLREGKPISTRELKNGIKCREFNAGAFDLGNLKTDEKYPAAEFGPYQPYRADSVAHSSSQNMKMPPGKLLVSASFAPDGRVKVEPLLEKAELVKTFLNKEKRWFVSVRIPKEGLGVPENATRADLITARGTKFITDTISNVLHLGPVGANFTRGTNSENDIVFTVNNDCSVDCRIGIGGRTMSAVRNVERMLRTSLLSDTFDIQEMTGQNISEHMAAHDKYKN